MANTIYNIQYANIRDNILFNDDYNPQKYIGGSRRFDKVPVSALIIMAEAQLLNSNEKQNLMPSIKEIIEFCEQHHISDWYASGYAISYDRPDCRVSIDSVGSYVPVSEKIMKKFKKFFKEADELYADDIEEEVYCWFD